MTNKDKLAAWDAEFYLSLSSEPCYLCLSQQQRYVVGQALHQARWRTRWHGDASSIDLDYMVGAIERELADMTACKTIQQIKYDIDNIQSAISNIMNIVIAINSQTGGDTIVTPTVSEPVKDGIPDSKLDDAIGDVDMECADNDDKDHLYSAVDALVEYWIQNVTDFLEVAVETLANPAEVAANVIEAIPVLGLLPFDEIVDYGAFLIENMLDAWNAGITESFKDDFKCGLFCMILANNCEFTGQDLIDYLNDKIGYDEFEIAISSMQDAIAFISTGTLVSEQLLYAQLWIAIIVAMQGLQWVGVTGFDSYELKFAAGYDDTNNDWQLLCTDCAEWYRYEVTDFTQSIGAWTGVQGEPDVDGIHGEVITPNFKQFTLDRVLSGIAKVHAAKITYSHVGAIGNGSNDVMNMRCYSDNAFTTQVAFFGGGFKTDGVDKEICETKADVQSLSMRLFGKVEQVAYPDNDVWISKVEIWFTADSDYGTLRTFDTIC